MSSDAEAEKPKEEKYHFEGHYSNEPKKGTIAKVRTKAIEKYNEAKEKAKETVNYWSDKNKAARKESSERREVIKKEEKKAYREEEIKQAANKGKRDAERKYAPRENKSIQPAVRRASRGFDNSLFGNGNYYDLFGAPKKKAVPVRTTTFNPRTGKTTITEPITEKKKKDDWSIGAGFDMLAPVAIHKPAGVPNIFDLKPPAHGKKKKGKKKWTIGDLN